VTDLPHICSARVAQHRVVERTPDDVSDRRQLRVSGLLADVIIPQPLQEGEEALGGGEVQKAAAESGEGLLQRKGRSYCIKTFTRRKFEHVGLAEFVAYWLLADIIILWMFGDVKNAGAVREELESSLKRRDIERRWKHLKIESWSGHSVLKRTCQHGM
jgi:hypothetical protein